MLIEPDEQAVYGTDERDERYAAGIDDMGKPRQWRFLVGTRRGMQFYGIFSVARVSCLHRGGLVFIQRPLCRDVYLRIAAGDGIVGCWRGM